MDEEKGTLAVNNLIYRQPPQVTLTVNRTMRRQFFQKSEYKNGEIAVCKLNTGSDSLKTANCYLTFLAAALGTTPTANYGNGSAVNLVQNITVRSRSGTLMDQIDDVPAWSAKDIKHNRSSDWVEKYGSLMGIGATGITGTDPAILTATPTRFIIPLSAITGTFRPVGGVDMPPMAASGLEFRLALADYRTALCEKSGTVTGYAISDISIMCDCVTLSDDTQKTLNEEAAVNGLEYVYPRIHTSSTRISSTKISSQLAISCARANIITGVLRTYADLLNVSADSVRSAAWNVSQWQVRVGSLYWPAEPINDAEDGVESCFMAQYVYDKPGHPNSENAVSLTDFKTNGYGIMAASFERDAALNLTGVPLNSSRSAEVKATLASWSAELDFTVFLEYVAFARFYIDNVAVSI